MSTTIDQQFVEYVVKSVVSKPEAVKIDRRVDEKGVLLELTVDPEDIGRVIGKHGSTAQSLRTLLRALGTKNDARYNLKIIDVDARGPASPAAPVSSPQGASSGNDQSQASTAAGSTQADDQASTAVPAKSGIDKTRQELAELDDLDI